MGSVGGWLESVGGVEGGRLRGEGGSEGYCVYVDGFIFVLSSVHEISGRRGRREEGGGGGEGGEGRRGRRGRGGRGKYLDVRRTCDKDVSVDKRSAGYDPVWRFQAKYWPVLYCEFP